VTVSACLITRDDPHVAKAVACLRACPAITEIVIVDTGSEDGGELAESLADKYERYTGCNDADGNIADFADARARSYALATQPWVLWADSDDLIAGLEHLPEVLEWAARTPNARVLCPYEYKYHYDDTAGTPVYVQPRERLVRNDGSYRWERPVHETLVHTEGANADLYEPRMVWKHQRVGEPADKARNLRILRRYAASQQTLDAWTLYNLGCECAHAGEYKEAIDYLTRYVALSGWDEQRMLACFSIIDCYVALEPLGEYIEAFGWARRALALRVREAAYAARRHAPRRP